MNALMTELQTAERLGVSTRTLQRWRVTRDGPAWTRLGPRLIRYSEAAVLAWATGRTFTSRAAELATPNAAS